MNLLSHTERWLSLDPSKLIEDAKAQNRNFNAALKCVDSATPSLMKFGEGNVSDVERVDVFMHIELDKTTNGVLASVVKPVVTSVVTSVGENNSDVQFEVLHSRTDDSTRDLLAAFMCDFPDAIVTVYDTGQPLVMISHDTKERRFISLNNMLDFITHTKIIINVPKKKTVK